MKNIEEKLHKIGLGTNAFKVYTHLLESNFSTVLEVSKNLKLPRTTVHQNVEKLIQLGLVKLVHRANSKVLYAEGVENVNTLVDKLILRKKYQSETIIASNNFVDNLIDNLKSISSTNPNTEVDIKYLEEKAAIRALYDEILSSDEIKSYVNTSEILSHFPDNEIKFFEAAKRGCELWDLQIKSEMALHFRKLCIGIENYHSKFFPLNTSFHAMDYLIYQDSIAIVQGGQVPTAIVIKSKPLADNARTLYDLLWNFLPNE